MPLHFSCSERENDKSDRGGIPTRQIPQHQKGEVAALDRHDQIRPRKVGGGARTHIRTHARTLEENADTFTFRISDSLEVHNLSIGQSDFELRPGVGIGLLISNVSAVFRGTILYGYGTWL